jgi:Flp pilus assembly protein TadG
MHLIPHRSRSEDGASFIIIALAMVVLFGFAALSVDAAAAWAQRRQNQGAVDTALVAGALQTSGLTSAAAAQAAAESEVIRISYESMAPDMTFGEWQQLWYRTSGTPCTDGAAAAAGYTVVGPKSDCVTFTANGQRMRAKLPKILTKTAFANVIGADTIKTTAIAEVGIELDAAGAVLPFGIPSGAAAGQIEVCLKSGSNPQTVAPCDGPDIGNFGFLDVTQFSNYSMGTTLECGGTDNTRISRQIAQGVDHPLGESGVVAPGSPSTHSDITACTSGNFDARPWTLRSAQTGNRTGVLDDGLIAGIVGLPGLLTDTPNATISLRGYDVDDKPLWEYLAPAPGAPPSCDPSGPTPVDSQAEMLACLSMYATTGSTAQLFMDSIEDSPRWGWAPILSEATWPPGSSDPVNIYRFQNVWLQTTMWKCSANTCDAIHDPGEPLVGMVNGNDQVEAISAYQIPRSALSDELSARSPDGDGSTDYVIIN